MNSYIGVTGFTTRYEVRAAVRAWERLPRLGDRQLMIGVLAKNTIFEGEDGYAGTLKHPARYPRAGEIAMIFPPRSPGGTQSLNLIHYATREPGRLAHQLEAMRLLGGRNFHGFQLNVCWPDKDQLLASFEAGCKIVLQIGWQALEMVNHDPGQLRQRIVGYGDFLSGVLLDLSGGLGLPLDVEEIEPYVAELFRYARAHAPWLSIGVAGGLTAETLPGLQGLVDKYPQLSLDTESRIRTADDQLDIAAMESYLVTAHSLFVR